MKLSCYIFIISSLILLTSCTLTEPIPEITTVQKTPSIIMQTGALQSEARVGKVTTKYIASDTYADIKKRYEQSGYLSGISELIHESINLSRDLPINFDTCGEDNAFYDPETKSITLCYEIVKMLEDKFGSEPK